jgi:APA family basic amino acid/polyamine antiporter
LPRPFRTPGVPIVPILSAVASFALMASLSGETWLRLIVWMMLGLVIYFGYSRRLERRSQNSERSPENEERGQNEELRAKNEELRRKNEERIKTKA